MATSSSRLVQFRDAVRDDFRALMPSMKSIETHFGPFNLDELKAFVTKVPAVRVSIVGSAPANPVATREADVDLHCAAFIVAGATAAIPADVAALEIAEALTGRLICRPFTGFSDVPRGVKIENHYSGTLRETAGAGSIALFSVDWRQVVRIGTNAAKLRHDTPGAPAGTPVDASLIFNSSDPLPLSTNDTGGGL